jgi:hypothetical protein
VARGRLALDIVRERLALAAVPVREIEADLIGLDAVNRTARFAEPAEVRARVAGRADGAEAAAQIGAEVEALYLNGPSGGGGATASVREVVAVASVLIDRAAVTTRIVHEVA